MTRITLTGTYRFVSMEPIGSREILTLNYRSHLSRHEESVSFRGECTVWYSLPDYRRQGTMMEKMLSEFWEYAIDRRSGARPCAS